MKVITLRGIPPAIEKRLRKNAEGKRISLNKALIGLLEEASGGKRKQKIRYHDLDHLSGRWSKQEAESFQKSLGFQRNIEEDLWKKSES